jgi:hypothetical protein
MGKRRGRRVYARRTIPMAAKVLAGLIKAVLARALK